MIDLRAEAGREGGGLRAAGARSQRDLIGLDDCHEALFFIDFSGDEASSG